MEPMVRRAQRVPSDDVPTEHTHTGTCEHAFGEDTRNAGARMLARARALPRRRDASWGI